MSRNNDPASPLVVFVHGLDDGWQSWSAVARLLGPRWRAIALDLPWRSGNGYDWRRSGSAGVWLARYLEQLDQPADALVGHSYGANAVLDVLANTHPKTSAAVLYAPFYRPPSECVSWSMFGETRKLFGQVIADGLVANLGQRASKLDADLIETMARHHMEKLGPRCFTAMFEELAACGDLPLSTVSVPTLLLSGRKDPTLPESNARALAAAIPTATAVRVDDLHHTSHLHAPAKVASHIRLFLTTTGAAHTATSAMGEQPWR